MVERITGEANDEEEEEEEVREAMKSDPQCRFLGNSPFPLMMIA